jgi:hypothetical protein
MSQDGPAAIGISSGGTDVAARGIAGLAPYAPVTGNITNRTLISQCFCGGPFAGHLL